MRGKLFVITVCSSLLSRHLHVLALAARKRFMRIMRSARMARPPTLGKGRGRELGCQRGTRQGGMPAQHFMRGQGALAL